MFLILCIFVRIVVGLAASMILLVYKKGDLREQKSINATDYPSGQGPAASEPWP